MDDEEWLTIAAAARLSGHSVPLIAALLSGGRYTGLAAKNEAGHWRIEPVEFRRWSEQLALPLDLPRTIADVRSGLRVE